MDVNKLNTDEINCIRKLSKKLDSGKRASIALQRGKYKYPVIKLNNMHLTSENLLSNAPLCRKRLNKRYTVTDLQDDTQIGYFARQTLVQEIKRYICLF
jgi:hypothetical protein